jgi:hypothetical protein
LNSKMSEPLDSLDLIFSNYLLKKQYIRTSILCIAFGDAVDDPVDEASANVPVHPASEICGSVD